MNLDQRRAGLTIFPVDDQLANKVVTRRRPEKAATQQCSVVGQCVGGHDWSVATPDREESRTLASYEAAVERYLEHSAPPGPEMVRYLDRFAAMVGAGDVLELGSGPGWDALHLEALGLRVTRSDATPAFLTRLRAAGYDARFLDVRTGDLGGPWDGIIADAVLLHLDRPELGDVLGAVDARSARTASWPSLSRRATETPGPPPSSVFPATSRTGGSLPCATPSPPQAGECIASTTSPAGTSPGSTSSPSLGQRPGIEVLRDGAVGTPPCAVPPWSPSS